MRLTRRVPTTLAALLLAVGALAGCSGDSPGTQEEAPAGGGIEQPEGDSGDDGAEEGDPETGSPGDGVDDGGDDTEGGTEGGTGEDQDDEDSSG